jgi:riboflavin synthase
MRFRTPRALAPFIAEKGSVTVDGVSLTVNRVVDSSAAVEFELNLVPHTLAATTLGELQIDHLVHIEVDLVARYLKRLQECED